jgi:hypothetical protein
MSTVIDTTEKIIGELDEASGHTFKVARCVELGKFDEALQELTSASGFLQEAEHLIRREMKK